MSHCCLHRLISALEERGFIRRLPNRARALEVVKLPEIRPAATVTPIRPVAPAPANDTIEIPLAELYDGIALAEAED